MPASSRRPSPLRYGSTVPGTPRREVSPEARAPAAVLRALQLDGGSNVGAATTFSRVGHGLQRDQAKLAAPREELELRVPVRLREPGQIGEGIDGGPVAQRPQGRFLDRRVGIRRRRAHGDQGLLAAD
jgi:hypothetical protein